MAPEVRFMKLFRGVVKYNYVLDIENKPSIDTIAAASTFPYTERNLHMVALIKIPPKFHGEISGRIALANVDLGAVEISAPNEITWLTFDKQIERIVFPQPGEYKIELCVNEKPVHFITLQLVARAGE